MGNILTIFKREVAAYFNSILAWVFISIFVLLSMSLCFIFGGYIEGGDTSLSGPFFFWHPWVWMVLAPAIGMRLWSEERRLGTIELMLTMPVSPWQAIAAKFLAASSIVALSLLCTFPIVWTAGYLGDPDYGTIFCGYVASFLVGCSCLAITCAISAMTRSQVACFVIAVAISFLLVVIGFGPVVGFVTDWAGTWLSSLMSPFSLMTHFDELKKGILVFKDLVFFLGLITFCLFLTSVLVRLKRS
jgi:ABC-2 type transport system permease protein